MEEARDDKMLCRASTFLLWSTLGYVFADFLSEAEDAKRIKVDSLIATDSTRTLLARRMTATSLIRTIAHGVDETIDSAHVAKNLSKYTDLNRSSVRKSREIRNSEIESGLSVARNNAFVIASAAVTAQDRRSRDIPTVTAISGQSVTVTCPNGNSNMKAESVKWEKADDSGLSQTHRWKIRDGLLTIEDVRRNTDAGSYKCTFIDKRGKTRVALVALRVLDLPSLSPFDFPSDMQVGMRLRAMCSIIRGDPPFNFSWLKDGVPLSAEMGLSVQYFRDYSMISSDSVQLKHSGNYTCLVNNEVGYTSHSAILKINAPPSWIMEPRSEEVVSGKSVVLACSAAGSPTPSISWKRSTGESVDSYSPVYNSHKYTLNLNGSLTVNDASPTESGFYMCQASNGYGGPISKVISLTIREPAKFEVPFKTLSVKKGDKITLTCEAKGDHPIKFSWKRDNEELVLNHRFRVEPARSQVGGNLAKAELHIKWTTKEDAGIYTCEAKNGFGKDECRVKLLVQEVPSPPSNITVVNVTGRAALLTWSEPFNGNSPVLGYALEYREAALTSVIQTINVSLEETVRNYLLPSLSPATRYNLCVKALNSVGWSEPSEWFTFLTDEEAPSASPTNITSKATGPNSVKVSWTAPLKDTWNGILQGFNLAYKPADSDDPLSQKMVDFTNGEDRYETHLTNLKRATIYVVSAAAYNKKGVGPPSAEIKVKTLDDVPPSAPVMEVIKKTSDSLTLSWTQRATFGNPVTEYVLHHKKEGEQWRQIPISTSEQKYVVQNLECGTTYKFYLTAHNSVGKSEPSEILASKTEGAAPVSPTRDELVTVNQREAILGLRHWKSGGCPIQSYTVKIRNKTQWPWKTLANNLLANTTQYVIKNLISGTDYEILVVAHSSAGSTEDTYEFRTLDVMPTKLPGTAHVSDANSKQAFLATDIEIILPVIVSAIVVLVVLAVGLIMCSKERQCFRPNREAPAARIPVKHTCEAINMKELAGMQQECGYSDDGTQRSSSQSTSHYHGGPSGYFTRIDEDSHPYATPYDILPVPNNHQLPEYPTSGDARETFARKVRESKSNNIYSTHRQDPRDRPYEALMV